MLQFFATRRTRRQAIHDIAPFLDLSRRQLNGIADAAFTNPYMIGYLSTLITLCAKRFMPLIGTSGLALVQSEAWARMTGLSGDLLGEETCYLSAARHPEFLDGCRKALSFFQALHGDACEEFATEWASISNTGHVASPFERATELRDLWARYFDAHIAKHAAPDWTDRL
jgi:hypothetical protein